MRKRARLIPVVLALAVLAASVVSRFGTANSHADFLGILHGNVGPDFNISLVADDGTPVNTLGVGTYEILVNDQATNHNFHLEGPGVGMATTIENIETADWMVDLTDGRYVYHCDRHSSLTAAFTVGTGQALAAPVVASVAPVAVTPVVPVVTTPAPVTPVVTPSPVTKVAVSQPASDSFMGTLKASLGPGDTIVLTSKGQPVKTLAQGVYRFVVSDRSAKRDVVVRQTSGGSFELALTGRSFVGTKSVSVDLRAGQWKLYSPTGQALFTFFRVAKS